MKQTSTIELHANCFTRSCSNSLQSASHATKPLFLYHFIMASALGAVYRYAIPIAIGASFVQASIYDVKGGSRAVIFDRVSGVKENVINEGTHFLIPWLQKAIVYDVRTKPRNISTTTGSKDLQMVSLTLRVLHRPEVKMLPKIYQVSQLRTTPGLRQILDSPYDTFTVSATLTLSSI